MDASRRCTGTVKWFNARKGFGFITPDDSGEDLFVHQTSIQSDGFRTLSEGQPVEYAVEVGEDGRAKASDVVGVSGSRSTSRVRFSAGGRRGFSGGRGRDGGGYSSGGGYRRGWRGGPSAAAAGGGGACYNCGRYGHLARDCYQATAGGGGGRGRYGGGGGGCYNCGDEGHFARDCPNTDRN